MIIYMKGPDGNISPFINAGTINLTFNKGKKELIESAECLLNISIINPSYKNCQYLAFLREDGSVQICLSIKMLTGQKTANLISITDFRIDLLASNERGTKEEKANRIINGAIDEFWKKMLKISSVEILARV